MTAALIDSGAAWIGACLAAVGAAAGCWALVARSFMLSGLWTAFAGACCAGALAAFGGTDAALLMSAVVVGWAPLVILGASLLGVDRVTPTRARSPWLSIAGASAIALIIVGVVFVEHGADASSAIARHGADSGGLGLVVFVAVMGAVALLGYGERGGLGRGEQ